MPDLSATAILDLWETGDGLGPVERSVALAAAVGSEPGLDDLARLPLGRRDARLLRLHRALVGRTLDATAACPLCGEQTEFELDAAALLDRNAGPIEPEPVEVDGFHVVWRPPDSRDVAAAGATADAGAAERTLLERCVTTATGPGGAVDAAALTNAIREAVSRAMADADPLAEVLVTVACPGCETEFVADIEVGSFVWAELRAGARRLLHEIDVLARAYGWTESEVLALGERRRASYLRLVAEAGR